LYVQKFPKSFDNFESFQKFFKTSTSVDLVTPFGSELPYLFLQERYWTRQRLTDGELAHHLPTAHVLSDVITTFHFFRHFLLLIYCLCDTAVGQEHPGAKSPLRTTGG
jgi:hypothetical protein